MARLSQTPKTEVLDSEVARRLEKWQLETAIIPRPSPASERSECPSVVQFGELAASAEGRQRLPLLKGTPTAYR